MPAFHEHIRQHSTDDGKNRRVVEDRHAVYSRKRRDDLSPLLLGLKRPIASLKRPKATVTVHRHNQKITEFPCSSEETRMPRMEQIKASIGEDNSLGPRFFSSSAFWKACSSGM